jgi:glycosyltransferase involved in cell wall biosynthesis
MIHDLIPITHPEYVRPAETPRHRRRIAAVTALADAVLVNSAATADVLRPFIPPGLPVGVVPLGGGHIRAIHGPHAPLYPSWPDLARPAGYGRPADEARMAGPSPAMTGSGESRKSDPGPGLGRAFDPYFLIAGTVEPRKNHLLLLHLWRRMVEQYGARAPILAIAGRRGWENENIRDMLDPCPALARHVIECGPVPHDALAGLISGARALLMPSFAEGFGLPVAEALALGTPVLCSDIPALRETGGVVPEYLDPLDAPAWQTAILDYTAAGSPRRAAQIHRMPDWRPVSWADHVAAAVEFLDQSNGRPT